MAFGQNKTPLVIFNILFLVISIVAGVIVVRQNQDVRSQAATVPTLSLKTDSQTIYMGDRLAVIVAADTITQPVSLVKSNLTYDPQYLKAVDVTPADFFTKSQVNENHIDPNSGTIFYSMQTEAGSPPGAGSGSIAIIVFEPLMPGVAEIFFRPDSQLQATVGGTNILEATTSLKIDIQASQ